MSAITWANVVDFDSSLSTVNSNAQTAILAHVNAALNLDAFDGEDGYRTRLARIFLAAHLGASAVPGSSSAGAAGPIVSESGGDGLSVTYAVTAAATSGSSMSETKWGRKYLEMVRTSPTARTIVVLQWPARPRFRS